DVSLPYADRLVAFGWRDPSVPLARDGVVVITRAMLDEIAAHIAAGRLPEDFWRRLLVHERDFHLGEHPEHTGARHDLDAAALAAELLWARARAGLPVEGDLLRLLRVVEKHLLEHPVLAVLGTAPLPTGTRPDPPAERYGEYFANPDFRASQADRQAYLDHPPVSARLDEAINRSIDTLGGIASRVPRADLHAILVYLSALFAEPNAALRSGSPEAIADYETFIRVATSGFNQLPARAGITSYRGIRLSDEDIARLPRTHPIGGLVVDAGFTSTELPDDTDSGGDPTAGLRTPYYTNSPVTIEVRSHTGRDSWALMRAITGRFHELTLIPGSTFVIRELHVTRDSSGHYTAHMVWEDVSHLRPVHGTLHQLHAGLLSELTELRGHITHSPDEPLSGIPGFLELTRRLLDARFTTPAPSTTAATPCTNCGAPLIEDALFCEACGTPAESPRGEQGSGHGGPLADGEWSAADTEVLVRVLPRLVGLLKTIKAAGFRMPRGPPWRARTWVLDEDAARVVLDQMVARGELSAAERDRAVAALGKLVLFGWRDPAVRSARRGVVVTTTRVLAELAGHREAGRMTRWGLRRWWKGAHRHERVYHLSGR
ncbi:MAG: zinc-ribbon domain-containing protein, partial [Pseudonocardia sp.]